MSMNKKKVSHTSGLTCVKTTCTNLHTILSPHVSSKVPKGFAKSVAIHSTSLFAIVLALALAFLYGCFFSFTGSSHSRGLKKTKLNSKRTWNKLDWHPYISPVSADINSSRYLEFGRRHSIYPLR